MNYFNFQPVLSLFRVFNQNFVAQLWYFVKCIYFGLSALQIRCGYPTRILGNFLTKKYNHLNLFLFQGCVNLTSAAVSFLITSSYFCVFISGLCVLITRQLYV